MRFAEYEVAAMRTAGHYASTSDQMVCAALGLAGESGEYADKIKKCVYHGHELDQDGALKELGDVLWYLALAAHAHGTTLDKIAKQNIDKLRARYPQGFSTEASVNRDA